MRGYPPAAGVITRAIRDPRRCGGVCVCLVEIGGVHMSTAINADLRRRAAAPLRWRCPVLGDPPRRSCGNRMISYCIIDADKLLLFRLFFPTSFFPCIFRSSPPPLVRSLPSPVSRLPSSVSRLPSPVSHRSTSFFFSFFPFSSTLRSYFFATRS